ncbi:predicted protein [Sclerotinia sclerotiorum 1980 UF-70]|uniref:Uncharacterized protein n=1 Tax=Sclerotinia sclerotiorum (strain ATCC 18683 / 1980 / Ss-1) TaxID=665079 RepID=A7E9H0_SCLS1|nr:predicted protein [Sclerotinia sclerotiorum 1980 UF-70]EDN97022.1 predicted protein [Sclerotinia sclerotiorum 1980 UF-70]
MAGLWMLDVLLLRHFWGGDVVYSVGYSVWSMDGVMHMLRLEGTFGWMGNYYM